MRTNIGFLASPAVFRFICAPSVSLALLAGLTARAGTSSNPAAAPPGYSVPESPAASITTSSTSIQRPTTPDAAAVSALTAFDGDSIGNGWSAAYDPGQWWWAGHKNKETLQMTWLERFIYRFELSAAAVSGVKNGTTKTGANSTGSDLGFGVRDVFSDNTDPRFDEDLRTQAEAPDLPPLGLQKLVNTWKSTHWNAAAFGFGSAINFTSLTNQYSTLKYDGVEEWLTGSYPINYRKKAIAQLIGSGTYRFHQYVITKGVASHENVTTLGVQVRFGQSDKGWDAYLQASESWKQLEGGKTAGTPIYGLGGEYKINWLGGFWLQAGWSNSSSLSGHSFFGTSVRYAIAAKPSN